MKSLFLLSALSLFSITVTAQRVQKPIKAETCDDAKVYSRLPRDVIQVGLLSEIHRNRVECVKEILKTGLNPNFKLKNESGTEPILAVLDKGNAEIMRELIKAGANVKSEEGKVALHASAQFGYFEIVKMLLDEGLDVNSGLGNKTMPLMLASNKERENVVQLLLKSGADVNAITDEGLNSLMLAANNSNIVKALIKSGAEISAVDNKGWSALFYAIRDAHAEKLEILLESGAVINQTDKNGMTPLLLAEQIKDSFQKEKTILLLKKYSAK
jgi:ankyrin repeat protein